MSGAQFDLVGPEFAATMRAIRDADKVVHREMVKAIRASGAEAVSDVKTAIGRIPTTGRYHMGIRTGLQAGTRMQIMASRPKSAGVRITTSSRNLPDGKKPLARALNLKTFHPIRSGTVGTQASFPYFGSAIARRVPQMRVEIRRAMNTAAFKIAEQVGRTNRV